LYFPLSFLISSPFSSSLENSIGVPFIPFIIDGDTDVSSSDAIFFRSSLSLSNALFRCPMNRVFSMEEAIEGQCFSKSLDVISGFPLRAICSIL